MPAEVLSACPAPADRTAPLSLLEKASLVLRTFDGDQPRLSLTEVVRRSGVPRSSAHRILDQLVQLRWLEREGRDYRLGLGMLELGGLAAHHNRLRRAALPHLHALHELTGHLVHLTILDGTDIVHLERIGGADDTTVPSRIGGRAPAYCTGAGKVILAYSDPATVEQVIGKGMRPRTPNTLVRPESLRRELLAARRRGVAFDREESYRGVNCVAAPLRGASRAIGAVSITARGCTARNMDRLALSASSCARSIWRDLFGPGRARRRPAAPRGGVGLRPGIPEERMDALVTWLRHSDWM
jgi:DNA-binding IclR family transcriptional regulator